jgi:hypothetical protein
MSAPRENAPNPTDRKATYRIVGQQLGHMPVRELRFPHRATCGRHLHENENAVWVQLGSQKTANDVKRSLSHSNQPNRPDDP